MNRHYVRIICFTALAALLGACSSAANSSATSDASSASTSDAAPAADATSPAADAASPDADATSPASDAGSADNTANVVAAIKKFVADEDGQFADLKGSITKQGGGMTFYASSLGLPGAATCAVYKYDKTGNWFVNCYYPADTEEKARTIEARVIAEVTKAESGWNVVPVKPLPPGNLTASMVRDPSNKHGVYVYTDKAGDGSYRVDVTFGTIAALSS